MLAFLCLGMTIGGVGLNFMLKTNVGQIEGALQICNSIG